MSSLFIEIAGWTGAVLILTAYLLVSSGKVGAQSATFQGLNLVGSIGFIINTSAKGAWPTAALNVVWCVIGIFALWQIWRARRRRA